MNIEDYDIEDFACDHSFQQYCREENDSSVSFWTAWLREHPDKAGQIDRAKQLVFFLSAGQGNRLEQLSHLKRGLQQRNLLETSIKNTLPVKNHAFKSKAYITALAAFLTMGVIGYFLILNNPFTETKLLSDRAEYSSTAVDRKTVILPDGSRVTLNKNSTIVLSPDFSKTRRDLTLKGEGFFEVSHDPENPFFVHTNAITVKVLGTVFNITAYPQDKGETATTLLKGKVEVSLNSTPSKKYLLKPNEKLITKISVGLNPGVADISLEPTVLPGQASGIKPIETAWLRQRLELSNERLEEITRKLEQWYGIEIEFEDDLPKSYRYSGTFESETVLQALEALQLSYPFKIKTESQKIIISK